MVYLVWSGGQIRWHIEYRFLFYCVLRVFGNMIFFNFLLGPLYGQWKGKNRKQQGVFFLQMAEWGIKTIHFRTNMFSAESLGFFVFIPTNLSSQIFLVLRNPTWYSVSTGFASGRFNS